MGVYKKEGEPIEQSAIMSFEKLKDMIEAHFQERQEDIRNSSKKKQKNTKITV